MLNIGVNDLNNHVELYLSGTSKIIKVKQIWAIFDINGKSHFLSSSQKR